MIKMFIVLLGNNAIILLVYYNEMKYLKIFLLEFTVKLYPSVW